MPMVRTTRRQVGTERFPTAPGTLDVRVSEEATGAVPDWLNAVGVRTLYIEPGSP